MFEGICSSTIKTPLVCDDALNLCRLEHFDLEKTLPSNETTWNNTHTHTHTHTHTLGTLHRHNDFYTVKTVYSLPYP